jgi:post-segregation antitoxin (ccd killing protein)
MVRMADTSTKTRNTKTKPAAADRGVGVNVTIPTALHRRLRVRALNEGMSMADAIEAAVKTWLR